MEAAGILETEGRNLSDVEASVLDSRVVILSKEERQGFSSETGGGGVSYCSFQSQTGFGGRFRSGVALSVWKNGETIMVAVVDRGQKVRRRWMKDQD